MMRYGNRFYHYTESGYIFDICPDYVRVVNLGTGTELYSETPRIIKKWETMESEKNRVSNMVFHVLRQCVNPSSK